MKWAWHNLGKLCSNDLSTGSSVAVKNSCVSIVFKQWLPLTEVANLSLLHQKVGQLHDTLVTFPCITKVSHNCPTFWHHNDKSAASVGGNHCFIITGTEELMLLVFWHDNKIYQSCHMTLQYVSYWRKGFHKLSIKGLFITIS